MPHKNYLISPDQISEISKAEGKPVDSYEDHSVLYL